MKTKTLSLLAALLLSVACVPVEPKSEEVSAKSSQPEDEAPEVVEEREVRPASICIPRYVNFEGITYNFKNRCEDEITLYGSGQSPKWRCYMALGNDNSSTGADTAEIEKWQTLVEKFFLDYHGYRANIDVEVKQHWTSSLGHNVQVTMLHEHFTPGEREIEISGYCQAGDRDYNVTLE